jgi:DNA-binding MarR family transcriptional regulator
MVAKTGIAISIPRFINDNWDPAHLCRHLGTHSFPPYPATQGGKARMKTPFEELANLDKLIHEPARLSILTALSVCESADFLALRRLTGLSDGNLSVQLSKLEEAGLVEIQKQFVAKKSNTRAKITKKGNTAVQRHWEQLDALRKNASSWEDDASKQRSL